MDLKNKCARCGAELYEERIEQMDALLVLLCPNECGMWIGMPKKGGDT